MAGAFERKKRKTVVVPTPLNEWCKNTPQLWRFHASGRLVQRIWRGAWLDTGDYPRIVRNKKDFMNHDNVKEFFPGDEFCEQQAQWRKMDSERARDTTWARIKVLVEEGIGIARIGRAFGLDPKAIMDKAVAEQWPHPLSDISPIPLVEGPMDMLPVAERERVETILTQKLLMDHWETIGERFRSIMMGIAAKGAKEALRNPPAIKSWNDVEKIAKIGRDAAGIEQRDKKEIVRMRNAQDGIGGAKSANMLIDANENESMELFDTEIEEGAEALVESLVGKQEVPTGIGEVPDDDSWEDGSDEDDFEE
jgi:hypothetical protein